MGTSTLLTNSYHHQAVKELAPGFRVNARTKDGIVEGIEKIGESWMLGVQWHPEFMVHKHVQMLKLFQALTEAASFYRSLL